MTLVKICGNRTPEDVIAAAAAGADFVGMVFAESKRQIDVTEAQAMVRALGASLSEYELRIPPPVQMQAAEEIEPWFQGGSSLIESYLREKRPLTVGVFANQEVDQVNELAEEAGVDLVQLSGHESWEDCLRITRQVIQVVHVSSFDSPSDPFSKMEPGFSVAVGLDSVAGPYQGGSGHTFDWEIARQIADRIPIMLAGGLTPENVGEAVRVVEPWIVDVSSGTETDGRKDHDLGRAFINAVDQADAE